MAVGKKTGGRDFKKGWKGGPGRPAIPLDLKESRAMNKTEFERVLNKYLFMSGDDINATIKDLSKPMHELVVAKMLAKAFNEGDQKRLEFIINRLIGGAPKDPITGPPSVFELSQKATFSEFCVKAGYPPPYPKQVEMVDFGFNETDPRVLLGSRGYGKTDYVTILGTAYDIYLNEHDTSNLITSKSKTRNTAMAEEIAHALEANGAKLEKATSTRIRYKGLVGKEDSVELLSLKSSFRGRHPFRLLMDDPVTEEDVSPAQRKVVKLKYSEGYKLCKNILIIGQPAHADDLYAELRPKLKTMLVPHGTIPELDADLDAMLLAGVDKVSIEMSYHLRVPVEGSMPFSKIRYIDRYPEGVPSLAFIDPSDGGDYTAVTVFTGLMNGVAVKGKVWKRPWYHCLAEMTTLFKETKVQQARFETNSTGRQPILQLQDHFAPLGIGIVGAHSDTNKHAVIMAAGSYANLIHLSRESDQLYTEHVVKYEYGVEFDDAPDSLARGLEWMGYIKGKPSRGK